MKKTLKYIYATFFTLLSVFVLTLIVSFIEQTTLHKKYGIAFNSEREKLGIYPIIKFNNVNYTYWKDYYPDNPIKRWTDILTNVEIANTTEYTNSSNTDKPYHRTKTIIYGTQLCFWQNYYGGEIDDFIKPIDNDIYIKLFVIYYSENITSSPYFYANIDTINKKDKLLCGTPDNSIDPEINKENECGNITKEQADKILTEWGIKIK